MVYTVQSPAENKMSFLRYIQIERMMFLSHRQRAKFSLTGGRWHFRWPFMGSWKPSSSLSPPRGLFGLPFSAFVSGAFANFPLTKCSGDLSFLAEWYPLLGQPYFGCLQTRWCSSPCWLLNAYLPALPFHFFLILSVLFGGLGHRLVNILWCSQSAPKFPHVLILDQLCSLWCSC